MNGSANVVKLTGTVKLRSKLDSVLAILTPSQIASLQTAFDGSPSVKVEVSSDLKTGTMWVTCSGDATVN